MCVLMTHSCAFFLHATDGKLSYQPTYVSTQTTSMMSRTETTTALLSTRECTRMYGKLSNQPTYVYTQTTSTTSWSKGTTACPEVLPSRLCLWSSGSCREWWFADRCWIQAWSDYPIWLDYKHTGIHVLLTFVIKDCYNTWLCRYAKMCKPLRRLPVCSCTVRTLHGAN